jgi:hypothetical protein
MRLVAPLFILLLVGFSSMAAANCAYAILYPGSEMCLPAQSASTSAQVDCISNPAGSGLKIRCRVYWSTGPSPDQLIFDQKNNGVSIFYNSTSNPTLFSGYFMPCIKRPEGSTGPADVGLCLTTN